MKHIIIITELNSVQSHSTPECTYMCLQNDCSKKDTSSNSPNKSYAAAKKE